MIKHNNLFIAVNIAKVVFQPFPSVVFIIAGFEIASCLERGYNIMNVADIKRIPYRTVNAFIKLFAILSFYVIVIADYISDCTAHSFGVHILNMLFESVLIANVARMYQKCRIVLLNDFFDIIKPFARARSTDFRI